MPFVLSHKNLIAGSVLYWVGSVAIAEFMVEGAQTHVRLKIELQEDYVVDVAVNSATVKSAEIEALEGCPSSIEMHVGKTLFFAKSQ